MNQSLPLTAAPEVFGLHDNASITRAQSDTVQLLKSVLLTESSGGGSGGSDKETTINNVAADILSKVPLLLVLVVLAVLVVEKQNVTSALYVVEQPECPVSSESRR